MEEQFNNDLEYERAAEARRLRRQKRRRRAMITRLIFFVLLALLAAIAVALVARFALNKKQSQQGAPSDPSKAPVTQITETAAPQTEAPQTETAPDETMAAADPATEAGSGDLQATIEEARLLGAGYDYDGAIALLQSVQDAASNSEVQQLIAELQQQKDSCVAVDVTTVPHIFYHSLVNDPSRAFNAELLGQFAADGMNAWMTTVEEFDRITQQMYDNGYVFVRLRDLVVQTTDADGTVHFTPNTNLLLPPDRKPVVLSIDDLSYYHSYETASYPDKLVLDENGDVKCHYVKPDGTEEVGNFDVVPRLNAFLEEHPDGAYRGARGLIALTGYNGVFGYRTDTDYETRENLMEDQAKWLEEHPDFDRAAEIAEATKIAEALKEEGWEFASHTWGHLSVTNKTVDELRADNEKWVNTVQNIVGPVDTIIFAHGNDIGSWEGYSSDNDKYNYFKNAGYNFYCNVDGSTPYWVQISDQYVRQGRINLDGYMLYQSSQGNTTVLDHMFKASEVFDSRRPTPVVANGES